MNRHELNERLSEIAGSSAGCEKGPHEEALREIVEREKDNWKHRSAGMRCATCMYFTEKETPVVQYADKVIGRCRRHAPTMSGWPVMFSNDWCGDHKLDETKV